MALILKNCRYIVTQNKKRDVLEHNDICIESNKIISLQHHNVSKKDYVIDCSRHIVLPGLINSRAHFGKICFRGKEDKNAEKKLKDHDVYKWTSLRVVEAIKSGTTTVCDSYFFPFSIAKAMEDIGIRGFVAGIPRNKIEVILIKDFIRAYKKHPLLIPMKKEVTSVYTPTFDMRHSKIFPEKKSVLGTEDGTDMFEEMRIAALLQNYFDKLFAPQKILDMATLNGGILLKKPIGIIAPKYLADITVLKLSEHLFPISKENVIERIIYNAKAGDVCTVIIDGNLRYSGGNFIPLTKANCR